MEVGRVFSGTGFDIRYVENKGPERSDRGVPRELIEPLPGDTRVVLGGQPGHFLAVVTVDQGMVVILVGQDILAVRESGVDKAPDLVQPVSAAA